MNPKPMIPLALVSILAISCIEVQEGQGVTWELSFEFPEDHSCTGFEGALIYCLIMEWFYFG